MTIGIAMAKLGRHTEAIAAYKTAIRIEPDDADVYYNMHLALDELGRRTEAIAALRRAVSLDPYGDAGRTARSNLQLLGER